MIKLRQHQKTVGWVNGHDTENRNSDYGDGSGYCNTWDQTTMRCGYGITRGRYKRTEYFFLYIEVPIYAKDDGMGTTVATQRRHIADFWKYD